MNNNKLLIISDFDGTISLQDVNDSIFNNLGDDKSQEIEILFQNEEIGLKEALRRHYKRINITEEEFVDYVKNNIELDPYFHNFYKRTIDNNIDLIIVSGGFINYIDILFNNKIIGNRNLPQALEELHDDAIYFLSGRRYKVKKLILDEKRERNFAEIDKISINYPYYTKSIMEEYPEVIEIFEEKDIFGITLMNRSIQWKVLLNVIYQRHLVPE
ncbi:MAG: HAD-IB family phosphatase [Candidatus Lokiarchaeota archaeon]|nr:HAD-IB family phosphatase [Candidatus Lokiarchaeota archaeon]